MKPANIRIHSSELAGQLQRGIPIPPKKNGQAPKWPIRQMQIGESFYAPKKANAGSFYSQAQKHGIKIVTRREGRGLRVWRTA